MNYGTIMSIIWEIHRYTDIQARDHYTDYDIDMEQKLIFWTLSVQLLLVRTFIKYLLLGNLTAL